MKGKYLLVGIILLCLSGTTVQAALEAEKMQALGLYNFGNTLLAQENWEAAALAYRKCLELDPELVPAYYNLCWVLLQQGRTAEAVEAWASYLKLHPEAASSLPFPLLLGGSRSTPPAPPAGSFPSVVPPPKQTPPSPQPKGTVVYLNTTPEQWEQAVAARPAPPSPAPTLAPSPVSPIAPPPGSPPAPVTPSLSPSVSPSVLVAPPPSAAIPPKPPATAVPPTSPVGPQPPVAVSLPAQVVPPQAPRKAQAVVEEVPQWAGQIDWTHGLLLARGQGRAPATAPPARAGLLARRVAFTVAQRNLVAVAQQVRLNSERTLGPAQVPAPGVQRFEAFLRDFTVRSQRQQPDGSWEVVLSLPLYKWPNLTALLSSAVPLPPAQGSAAEAVILDARGVEVRPCLFPRLLHPRGEVIYDLAALAQARPAPAGVARYFASLEEAQQAVRAVWAQPIVLRVVKAAGRLGGDLVLSAEDAERLRQCTTALAAHGLAVVVSLEPRRGAP